MKKTLILFVTLLILSCQTNEIVVEEDENPLVREITETPITEEQKSETKEIKVNTNNLEGKSIKVVTHIDNMVEILTKLESNYPEINWIPTEYVHSSYYLSPNSRDTYGNYLILETTGKKTNLIPNLFYMGDHYKNDYYRRDNLNNSENISTKITYFQQNSVLEIIESLPNIINKLNDNLIKHDELFLLPFKEIFPERTTPFLNISNEEVITIDKSSQLKSTIFNYKIYSKTVDGVYTWSFESTNIPSEIKQVFISVLHYEDINTSHGRYSTVLGNVENNTILLTKSISASWVKGTKILAMQLLKEDNTLLSYPYDLLPRIKEYDSEYFNTYSQYIYWNHYDHTADF